MSGIAVARRGAVLGIGFDRPEKKNALTAAMYTAMAEALVQAATDATVRVILFHGSELAFTAGNDLEDFAQRPPTGEDAPVFRFLLAVAAATKPLVAAVNGPAVGLGTTLLLHCDLVYAGEGARFSMPFTRLGLVPEFGSSYLLPLVAGYQRAAEMLLLGEPFDAQRAREAGFVTRVVPDAQTLETAWAAAATLAELPARPVQLTRALLKAAHRDAIERQLRTESHQFRELLQEPAAREALAAFLEKRKPDFSRQ
ncbi:MAG TPA: enoyl-CoA hydratase [Usitatibacter sp.]|nr:enoyl-CoA hydratase [Usitatibacter sp.]